MIGGAESMEFSPSASHQGFSGNQFPHFHPPQEDKPSPAGEVGGLHVFCARDKGKLCKKLLFSDVTVTPGPPETSQKLETPFHIPSSMPRSCKTLWQRRYTTKHMGPGVLRWPRRPKAPGMDQELCGSRSREGIVLIVPGAGTAEGP